MYSYVDRSGARNTIVLRHVTSVFQKDADDTFTVCFNAAIPIEVPSECYDSFMEKLEEYVIK